jgi:hypothetical protein
VDEQIRQRELIRGRKLLCEAFDVLREPLDIDEQDSIIRPEVRVAFFITEARELLYDVIIKRQREGIRSAPDA